MPNPSTRHTVEATFLYPVTVFGTLANGVFLVTILLSKRLRQTIYILLGALAATDLFIVLVYIPTYTYYLLQFKARNAEELGTNLSQNQTNVNYCLVSRNIFLQVAGVTLTINTLIALHLYVLAQFRCSVFKTFSARHVFIYLVLAWVLNFVVIYLPSLLGYHSVSLFSRHHLCIHKSQLSTHHEYDHTEDTGLNKVHDLCVLSVHLLEVSLILFCIYKIHRVLYRGKMIFWQNQTRLAKEAKVHYTKATKTIFFVFTSTFVCFVPIYLFHVIDPTQQLIPEVAHDLSMDLFLLKAAIDPLLYSHAFRSLRHEMKLMCLCKQQNKKKNNSDESSSSDMYSYNRKSALSSLAYLDGESETEFATETQTETAGSQHYSVVYDARRKSNEILIVTVKD